MMIDLSTETDGSEPAKITSCRRVERSDVPAIARLLRRGTVATAVAQPDVMFEKACISLVQENEHRQVVSAMFLCNYPNIPEISQSVWPSWMNEHYDFEKSTEANTLFVHLLAWEDRYERDFLNELLTTAFCIASFHSHIILVQPPGVTPADAVSKVMTRIESKSMQAAEGVEGQVLYVAEERRLVPEMKFRLVVEEDNDDVVRLLDADAPQLRELYGDFYVSEMLRVKQMNEGRSIVVGEREGEIVAVLGLNRNFDRDLLEDRFDLAAFGDLGKMRRVSADQNEERDNLTNVAVVASEIHTETMNLDNQEKNEEIECTEDTCDCQESNAFALELLAFGANNELKCRGLLSAGFECNPGLDYCLALVPTDWPHTPVLENYFLRVPLKPDKDFPMVFYLTHRAALQGELRARVARSEDRKGVARLLEGVADASNVLVDFDKAIGEVNAGDGSREGFVFTCDDVVIGLAVVCAEDEAELLRRCYRAEDLRAASRITSRLLRLALMPIFDDRLGQLLGELMRLVGCAALCYRTTEDSSYLSAMRPVEPRIRNWPQFQRYHKREFADSPFEDLFSLFLITPRMTMIKRKVVNAKIVVVGASDCGSAFIDALTLGYKYRDLQFTDVTLISTNGLTYEHSMRYPVKLMIPFRGRYCHAYRKLTPSRANYNVIKGTVVAINRERKCVHVENAGTLSYDYLVLTCGLQFQRPELTINSPREDEAGEKGEDDRRFETPANCFLINDDASAENCLKEIERMTENFSVKKSIVLHGGSCVECYCALAGLLELVHDATWLTMMIEADDDEVFDEDNAEMQKTLRETITTIGVTIISSCHLVDWILDLGTGRIVSLLIEKNADEWEVACDAFFSFGKKAPCAETLCAIARSGLALSTEHLPVVDSGFRTSDSRVFAAGTLTGRECSGSSNSLEVGEKFAERFLTAVLRETEGNHRQTGGRLSRDFKPATSANDDKYRMPIVVSCLLPGGYRYLRVQKPGAEYTGKALRGGAWNDVFTSGSCTADTGYFRLRLNQFRTVECVTCFGKTDFDVQNIAALCGKHEALLGDLRTRFTNGEIPDLGAHFREAWTAAFYHDEFDAFRENCKCSCCSSVDDGEPIIDCKANLRAELMSLLPSDNCTDLTAEDRELIVTQCLERSCYPGNLEAALLKFLERWSDELPMYYNARAEGAPKDH